MENKHIDLGYEFWNRGYMFRESIKGETEALKLYNELCEEGTIETVEDFLDWVLCNREEMIYNYLEEEKSYREKNEPLIRKFFAKHFEGKTWEEIDPEDWDWYSDWHKDVFGYRPHGIICGEYINPHTVKCKHCGTELVEGINHSAESYEVDLCDTCMDLYYGYCDKCGNLFQYYTDMLEHSGKHGNVLCRKCLAED